jgi:hypothetical protein
MQSGATFETRPPEQRRRVLTFPAGKPFQSIEEPLPTNLTDFLKLRRVAEVQTMSARFSASAKRAKLIPEKN